MMRVIKIWKVMQSIIWDFYSWEVDRPIKKLKKKITDLLKYEKKVVNCKCNKLADEKSCKDITHLAGANFKIIANEFYLDCI